MKSSMNRVYILLGGNLGDVKNIFLSANFKISKNIGEITAKSHLYASPPWGFESENDFLNQVIEVMTPLSAIEVLSETQSIESDLGRVRNPKATNFESRKIDIDLLYFNQDVINTDNLIIPHYALKDRKFTLLPLVEIAPEYIHPVHQKNNAELLESCKDQNPVKKI